MIKKFEQFVNEGKNDMPIVKFRRWTCVVEIGKYHNGRTAISLDDKKTGEPIAVATVNIPEEHLEQDEVIIKDYSENEGMLDALVAAGIVEKPTRYVESGFIKAPVCKLKIK